ncbi:hypothetical protein [Sphingomonas sp. BK235]|uniref:hypothetical protein n=1 Tax=Sphingomonas sp. BK235 TaxID=2512131 RepID=UPI001053BD37|nr:hypothetical protein [Sphingomonas sp. BK235]TCP30356.1 hypothetical protein EV292_11329 [Sphingomonas sp. BK235]
MDVPTPRPGQVIRYEYLWKREADRGAEDGRKERPCALLLSQQMRDGRTEVFVLPITHSPPIEPALAIEIPQAVKRRLKLDDERSWIILSELNRTPWPNQDTRVVPGSKPETIVYGQLPEALYNKVRDRWLELVDQRLVKVVTRTE